MKKTGVVSILLLAISSALCAERNLECSSFEKNTTVMSDDVIQSLSKVVDDSLYTRWNAKNFIHNSFIACTCLCENKYSIQSRNNRKFYWVFNYCDNPDTVVTLEADSDTTPFSLPCPLCTVRNHAASTCLHDGTRRRDDALCHRTKIVMPGGMTSARMLS